MAEIEAYVENTVSANQLELSLYPIESEADLNDVSSSHAGGGFTSSDQVMDDHPPSRNASSRTSSLGQDHVVNLNINIFTDIDFSDAAYRHAQLESGGNPPGGSESEARASKEQQLLARMASMTGYTPNALLHELLMDPQFSIPSEPLPTRVVDTDVYSNSSLTSSEMSRLARNNPLGAGQALKKHMLRIMGDRMISSMMLSPYESAAEVPPWQGFYGVSVMPLLLEPLVLYYLALTICSMY